MPTLPCPFKIPSPCRPFGFVRMNCPRKCGMDSPVAGSPETWMRRTLIAGSIITSVNGCVHVPCRKGLVMVLLSGWPAVLSEQLFRGILHELVGATQQLQVSGTENQELEVWPCPGSCTTNGPLSIYGRQTRERAIGVAIMRCSR